MCLITFSSNAFQFLHCHHPGEVAYTLALLCPYGTRDIGQELAKVIDDSNSVHDIWPLRPAGSPHGGVSHVCEKFLALTKVMCQIFGSRDSRIFGTRKEKERSLDKIRDKINFIILGTQHRV